MSKLSRDDVLKLAALSKLRLSEQEVESLRSELSSILDYVEILDKQDTTGLAPTYQVSGLKNVMREDVVKDYQASPSDLLQNAPAIKDGQFKVKKVL